MEEKRSGRISFVDCVRSNRQKDLPRQIQIGTDGRESADGYGCVYFSAPFRFCLHCGVSYSYRQTTDFTKLTSLVSGVERLEGSQPLQFWREAGQVGKSEI